MKDNYVLYWGLAAFFVVVGVTYTVWNIIDTKEVEWAGTVALFLSATLAGFIAFYIGLVKKNQGGTLVEDLPDADIDDGDPETGEFSPWSWWPMLLGLSCSMFLMGFALDGNFFLVFFAAPFIVISIVGWVYEYYRGYFAR